MHEPRAPRAPQQHAQIANNLLVVLARQDRHDVRHGPDFAGQGMLRSDASDGGAAGEVGV